MTNCSTIDVVIPFLIVGFGWGAVAVYISEMLFVNFWLSPSAAETLLRRAQARAAAKAAYAIKMKEAKEPDRQIEMP